MTHAFLKHVLIDGKELLHENEEWPLRGLKSGTYSAKVTFYEAANWDRSVDQGVHITLVENCLTQRVIHVKPEALPFAVPDMDRPEERARLLWQAFRSAGPDVQRTVVCEHMAALLDNPPVSVATAALAP